jgi:dUTPase
MRITTLKTRLPNGDFKRFMINSHLPIIQSGSNMCNVYSNYEHSFELRYMQSVLVPTGIHIVNTPVRIHAVSPDVILALGYHVITSTFNAGFTGEVKLMILNTSLIPIVIDYKSLIGQLVVII